MAGWMLDFCIEITSTNSFTINQTMCFARVTLVTSGYVTGTIRWGWESPPRALLPGPTDERTKRFERDK